ncbi:MAG: adenosylmethionine--8-amino-7-oxononanoate transaminase [bacterium]
MSAITRDMNPITSPIWFPYSLMKQKSPILHCTSAKGVHITLENNQTLIDAMSSWWSTIHGYNHPILNQAANEQLNKVSHIMLGGFYTTASQKLADTLIQLTPKGLDKVFFSDSGSVGCEVAIKMALQYWYNLNKKNKTRLLTLEGGYHGDTIGCMALCDPNDGMHRAFGSQQRSKHLFLTPPKGGLNPKDSDLQKALSQAEHVIKSQHHSIAALMLEPIFQGASSMSFYSPVYLEKLCALAKHYNILVIFDEVATGFGRLGTRFAFDQCRITPDILVLGKGLSGGYLGLAATLASHAIFEAFLPEDKDPFMHGPTFCGNPLACNIAQASINLFESQHYLKKITKISKHLQEAFRNFKHPLVRSCRTHGAIAIIEVKEPETLKDAQAYALKQGIWLRPFSKFLYTTPAYIIKEQELQQITHTMKRYFKTLNTH